MSGQHFSQFELFPKDKDRYVLESSRPGSAIKDLTLSVENIIVLCIVLVMTFVLFFSYGVERGKALAKNIEPPMSQEALSAQEGVFVADPEGADALAQERDAPVGSLKQAEPIKTEEIINIPIERQLVDEDFYTIQIASFKQQNNANKELARIGKIGHDTFVVDKGGYSIVCVGKFDQKEQANQASKKLKSRYRDLVVRRL